MKRIVVATDMSERADRAIERALKLASDIKARCAVVSIVDATLPQDMATELRGMTERRLRKMLDAHNGRQSELDVRIGDVVPGVLGIASEMNADLLVLGIHRRRKFMDAVRETTMERILTLSDFPVLLVRDPVNGSYGRVLVATNFSRACAAAMIAAGSMAPGAEINSIHALHIPFVGLTGGTSSVMAKAIRRETEELARTWHISHGISGKMPDIVTGGIHEVLNRKIKSFEPELLVLGAHTRSGLGWHKLGTFAAEIFRNPPVDLLVARH